MYPQIKKLTGAQRLILQLARYTVTAGHRGTLVTHRLGDEPRAALAPGVAVIETGRRVDWSGNHYADAALEYALAPALVRHIPGDADALVCFGPPSMPALWWARRRGWGAPRRPLLVFLYEPPRFVDRDRRDVVAGLGPLGAMVRPALGWYGAVDRRLVRSADALLANGAYGAARLRGAYGRDAVVIPHGVDFAVPSDAAIAAVRARYDLPDAGPVLLTVNQLHPRKRVDLVIRALAEMRRDHPAAVALLVGRGVDEGRLRAAADEHGVTDAVRFAGFVAEPDLPAVYRAADVYVHAGRDETFGLSVLEAVWSGVPVVAVDEGGPREILGGGTLGRLVAADARAIAGGIRDVVEDRPAARARAEVARQDAAARYRWEEGAAALTRVTERLQRVGRGRT